MDTLQQELVDKIKTLPQNSLEFLMVLIDNYMEPQSKNNTDDVPKERRQIGVFADQDLYDPDYDFDELNSEIAEMFGVNG